MLSASRLPFPAPPAGTSRKSVPVPGVPAGFREDSGAADHVVRPGRNARNRSPVRPVQSDCHPLGPNLELGASRLRMGSFPIDDAVRDEAIGAWRHSGSGLSGRIPASVPGPETGAGRVRRHRGTRPPAREAPRARGGARLAGRGRGWRPAGGEARPGGDDVVVGAVDERLVGCVDARVLAADGTGKVTRIISHW